MKDNLEKFISEHRSQFNEEVPRENLWANIELALKRKKRFQLIRIYSVAASIAAIMFVSVLIFKNNNLEQKAIENIMAKESAIISDSQIEEAKMYYSSLIEVKRGEIDQFRKAQPQLVKEFDFQLQELNLMYKELIPQIKDQNKKEIVLQALISNLQLQLQILTKQLEIIQKVNDKKNEKSKDILL